MKNLNLNLNNKYTIGTLLTALVTTGYYGSNYLFRSKSKDNRIIIKKKESLTIDVKDNLLSLVENIRNECNNYVDKVINNRKLLCSNKIKAELHNNTIFIRGKNRKVSFESIYINTLQLNDKFNTILNSMEEIINSIIWFDEEDKVIYNSSHLKYYQELNILINNLNENLINYQDNLLLNIEMYEYIIDNKIIIDEKICSEIIKISNNVKINWNNNMIFKNLKAYESIIDNIVWFETN